MAIPLSSLGEAIPQPQRRAAEQLQRCCWHGPTIPIGAPSKQGVARDFPDGRWFRGIAPAAPCHVPVPLARIRAPRRILCDIDMHQDFNVVHLHITPLLGFHPDPAKNASRFPENALVVVQLTFDIVDYGGQALTPLTFAFTTQNLAAQTAQYLIENKGETPYLKSLTTAAVHPDPRAPERVQAYMLFAGDGDNGSDPLSPSLPKAPPACAFALQPNNDSKDHFDPFRKGRMRDPPKGGDPRGRDEPDGYGIPVPKLESAQQLRQAAAEQAGDLTLQTALTGAVTVLLRQEQGDAQGAAPGYDAYLVHRVVLRHQAPDDGMTRLVVGG